MYQLSKICMVNVDVMLAWSPSAQSLNIRRLANAFLFSSLTMLTIIMHTHY